MGAYGLFCHGTAVRSPEYGFGRHVQGSGDIRYPDRVLDVADHVAVDDQIPVEPLSGNFPHQEILRRHDAAPERRVVRPCCAGAAYAPFLRRHGGGLRGGGLQRRHARHRGRRRLHVGALDRGSGAVYRLAGSVLQPCETGRHGRPGLVRGLARQAFQRFRGGDLRRLCAVVDGGAGDPLRTARPAGYLPQPRVAVGRKCG